MSKKHLPGQKQNRQYLARKRGEYLEEYPEGAIYNFSFNPDHMGEIKEVIDTGHVGLLHIRSEDIDFSPLFLLSPSDPNVGCVVPVCRPSTSTWCTLLSLLTVFGCDTYYATWLGETCHKQNESRWVATTFQWKLFEPDCLPVGALVPLAPELIYAVPGIPLKLFERNWDFSRVKPVLGRVNK